MENTTMEKLVCLSWNGRNGMEVYYFHWNDAVKVIEQMQTKYFPIFVWVC